MSVPGSVVGRGGNGVGAVGADSKLTTQLACTARLLPQVLLEITNWGVVTKVSEDVATKAFAGKVIAVSPKLVSVIGCGGPVVLFAWLGKLSAAGRIMSDGPVAPIPLRATVCWPPKASLSETVSVPEKLPAVGGVNVTPIVQEPPGTTVVEQVFEATS
jgi:hypothetical protein